MKNEFLIVKNMKLFINSLDNIIIVIPNRDRVLKDRLYNTSYDILESLYRCNYSDNKNTYMKDILSKINMIDFYLERCIKNKYISKKEVSKKCNNLLIITKMIYRWINNESRSK